MIQRNKSDKLQIPSGFFAIAAALALNAIAQHPIFKHIRPLSAVFIGTLVMGVPYALARGVANRIASAHRNRAGEVTGKVPIVEEGIRPACRRAGKRGDPVACRIGSFLLLGISLSLSTFRGEDKTMLKLMRFNIILITLVFVLLVGCSGIGPKTVPRDRFDYNTAISDSSKEQTLLNIVKLRYADMPLFVEVTSIVSGYTLEGAVNLGGTVSSRNAVQGDFMALGTSGKYTDRPTITYVPITGEKFNKSFMTPIPPGAILFLMQSGWSIDLIFPLTVEAVNGLRSRISAGANERRGDPAFYRVIALLRKIQKSGAVGMRIKKENDQKVSTIMFFYRENVSPEIEAALVELGKILGLHPGEKEITVTYGLMPAGGREISMITRSMLQIMIEMAAQIDVPDQHVTDGLTLSSLSKPDSAEKKIGQLINIKSSSNKPEKAYTAVNYKDHWFWIDDRDIKSKRSFAFLMILFSMAESGGKEGLPLVTIPTG